MNYQSFKRHEYFVYWNAVKDQTGKYVRIYVQVTRDHDWPFGEVVTDICEFKYGCKVNNFNFDDLDIDGLGNYFIKEGSGEWNDYLNNPGIPQEDFIRGQINKYIQEQMEAKIKEEMSKKGINIPVHVIAVPVD